MLQILALNFGNFASHKSHLKYAKRENACYTCYYINKLFESINKKVEIDIITSDLTNTLPISKIEIKFAYYKPLLYYSYSRVPQSKPPYSGGHWHSCGFLPGMAGTQTPCRQGLRSHSDFSAIRKMNLS